MLRVKNIIISRGEKDLNLEEIGILQNVTAKHVFGKNIEAFFDYVEDKSKEPVYDEKNKKLKQIYRTKQITLSKGSEETETPLPIINALSKNFLKVIYNNPDALDLKNNPDYTWLPDVFKQTIKDLNLDESHCNEENWIYPKRLNNKDQLKTYGFQDDIDANGYIYRITDEILTLIHATSTFYKRSKLYSYKKFYKNFLKCLNIDQVSAPLYFMEQRFKELDFVPVLTYGADENYPMDRNYSQLEKPTHSFGAFPKAGLLSMAWMELYLAGVYEMSVSACLCCGTVYRQTNNYAKNTCGSLDCEREIRKEKYAETMKKNPENEIKDRNKRAQKHRDKDKTIKLYKEGKDTNEILKYINDRAAKRNDKHGERRITEIIEWINSYKNKNKKV